MPRIVVVSDLHLDWHTLGVPRRAELEGLLHKTVDAAIEQGADAWLFLGDLCDPTDAASVVRSVFALQDAVQRLLDRGIDVAVLSGNHDIIEDGSGLSTVSLLRQTTWGDGDGRLHVFDKPGSVSSMGDGFNFLALPYTPSSHSYDPAEFVKDWWKKGSRCEWEPIVVAGHLSIPGVQPGEETTEMPRGRDVIFPVEAFKDRDVVLLNGHYHRAQTTKEGIVIPGSLVRLTMGERDNHPGYLVLDVLRGSE